MSRRKPKVEMPDEVRKFFQTTGKLGGKTRAKNLTPEQRSQSARKAAAARWAKKKSA